MTFSSSLKDSWKNMKDYRNWIVLTVLVDIAALIMFAKAYIYTWTNAISSLNAVYESLGGEISDPALLAEKTAEFTAHYQTLMHYAWILLASTVLIWAISQGINWFLCSKIAMRKKIDFKYFTEHMLKFLVLSVLWFVAFLLLTTLSMKMNMSPLSILGGFNSYVMVFLFAVLFYFGLISYGVVPKYRLREVVQKTFKIGFTHYIVMIPIFLFSLILMSAVLYITVQISGFSMNVALAFFALVVLSSLSYVRILSVKTTEKLKA